MPFDPALADEQYCYLTTIGRRTGRPHEIEIWFALAGDRLYMLAGGRDRADWVRNLRRNPEVSVRLGATTYLGRASIVTDAQQDALARRLLVEKYQGGYSGSLTSWGRTALPVAVHLQPETPSP
jgi:deazaflavin-dependent oxidoreductase (nitroreductase family)